MAGASACVYSVEAQVHSAQMLIRQCRTSTDPDSSCLVNHSPFESKQETSSIRAIALHRFGSSAHVDTTTLVTHSSGCSFVYFTTRGLIAAWLLGLVNIRKLQLLWYRLLIFALGFSTVDCATTCVFDDFGASLFDYSLFRPLSIRPLSGSLRSCRLVRSVCSAGGRNRICCICRLSNISNMLLARR